MIEFFSCQIRLTNVGFLLTVLLTIPCAGAEEAAVPQPVIKVTLLGTGTPVPKPNQMGPSTLVETSDAKLLFDCGRGCGHRLWNVGPAELRETSHLFLTHMHSDHTVGIADFYLNGWILGRTSKLQVYGPVEADTLMHHLQLAYEADIVLRAEKQVLPVERESLNYTTTEVAHGKAITIGETTITPISVDHHVVTPAYGYRIDSGGYSVVISGDTNYSENLVNASKDADVLVHAVMTPVQRRYIRKVFAPDVAKDLLALHASAPEVGKVFSDASVQLGVLTHFDNDPKMLPELESEVRSNWGGDLVVGEDLTVIEIGESIRVVRPGE